MAAKTATTSKIAPRGDEGDEDASGADLGASTFGCGSPFLGRTLILKAFLGDDVKALSLA